MKILGFNPSHHGSVCLLEDGELKFFIQEERITKIKYTAFPVKSFINIIQSYSIDNLSWGTPSIFYDASNRLNIPWWQIIAQSFHKNLNSKDYSSTSHHVCHTAHAFYNSGFKKAIGVVIDGLGSMLEDSSQETETIFECSYPLNFKVLFKNISTKSDQEVNLSRIYETITMHLGWTRDEAGKTMGLAPYGKFNPNLPSLFKGVHNNPNVIYFDFGKKDKYSSLFNETFIDEETNPQLKLPRDPREWHYDESKITNIEKDLAWKVQNDTQQLVGDYIEKAIQETGLKQVCCAGGYFLNCVTNYYLLKRFPDIEFYFEPIANDAGTAIGAAKLTWYEKTQDTTIRPFKSLYLGKQYSKEELLEGIKKYVDTPQ